MTEFLTGLIAGVIIGGLLIDINLRAPARVKTWLASWFPRDAE